MRSSLLLLALAVGSTPGSQPSHYRPVLASPELLEPFLKDVAPGNDSFPDEREALELEARLGELGEKLKASPGAAARIADWLLAPGFRGGRLHNPATGTDGRGGALSVARSATLPQELALDARAFAVELGRTLEPFRAVTTAEFLVPSLELDRKAGTAVTEVRYDLVGPGTQAWRVQRVGVWRMTWRRTQDAWRVVEWTAASDALARAASPVFTEVTGEALGGNESFRSQLATGFDAWMATVDSVLTRDSNGHHGVSAGDADGDGLDDLYVAQPAGFPNRLFRATADGRFEDWTERSGLAVLDDTAASLFVDVENDGDQDLVLATATQLLLFRNDGSGRFAPVRDAFRLDQPIQGSLMSIAMADYDRDGFLDLYLCVYSYSYGAGEDKLGTPMPYHDARTGPPGILFRNDGRGRFLDATRESGIDVANDRYHFAAAWADYDGDGWVDLLVANDFGAKNLYRNRGRRDGRVSFEDVAAVAGVLDYGAGMSAAFLDYDNDGRLDIYTGNMWSAPGLRVTAHAAFMPDAPADVKALYRRHARGNSLFRNLGDGRFEDRSLPARAETGRWAWSSDAFDFDSDGWDDLYVANGMLTRDAQPLDLDGFFWRQVVARSPLMRLKGTPYDDGWRALNQMLLRGSIASRQRNGLLRNDGKGGFDEVAGAAGLDLDQDGRSFAVLDFDRDGDPDLAVMAARQAPQLRLFRNDYEARGARIAIRLKGTAGNRDAVGARVSVETDALRRTRVVQAGSGFLSQHSKELLVGLGASHRVTKLRVVWPSGGEQVFDDVPIDHRVWIEEGGQPRAEPLRPSPALPAETKAAAPGSALRASWLYEPFPAPDFSLPDLRGETRSLAALRGRPALVLAWASDAPGSVSALRALAAARTELERQGVACVAVALDPAAEAAAVRAAASAAAGVPVVHATRDVGLGFAILNRHLFMGRPDLELPTAFLLDAQGRVGKVYREPIEVSDVGRDAALLEAPAAERLSRAVPFGGTLYAPPGQRNYLTYGHELLNQDLEGAALAAFERAALSSPTASTLYRLGTLLARTGQPEKARGAFEKALAQQPGLAEASNDLGTLLAQQGDLPAAIGRFEAALRAAPDYPDALNNLGYALLLSGRESESRALYEKALALQPDFPEALNNLGLLYGRAGDLARAESHFRDALGRRADYAEAASNLALVLVARGDTEGAAKLLAAFVQTHPEADGPYLTLAKIYLTTGRRAEGVATLERLLHKNPNHLQAQEILKQSR